jgi:hypothetical protein
VDNELSPSTAKKREAPPAEQGRTKRAKERGEDDAEARAQIPEERDEEAPAGVGNKAAEQRKTTGGDAQDEQVRRLAAGDAAAATQDSRGGCDSGPCGGEGVPEEMPQRMDLPMVEVLPMVHFQMDSVKPVSGAGAQAAGPSLAKAWPKRCFAKSGGPTTNRAAAQLQCPKCAHAYDTQTAPPLLLPCLHSLCSPCAAADQLRICPQCDFPYEFFSPVASSSEVWGGGERVLLACENKALVEKCSVMAILWGGTVQCGECKAECGDQGAFCAECHTFLCCFCSAHHRRALITKAHTIKTMDQVKCLIHRQTLDQVTCPLHRQGGGGGGEGGMEAAGGEGGRGVEGFGGGEGEEFGLEVWEGQLCQTHPDTALDMYCVHCELVLCSKCALVAHNAPPHKVEMSKKSAGDYVSGQLRNSISSVEAHHARLDHAVQEVKGKICEAHARREAQQEKLRQGREQARLALV